MTRSSNLATKRWTRFRLRLSFAPFRSLRGYRAGVRKAKPAVPLAPGSRELEGGLPSVRRSRLRTCILQAPCASKPSLKSGLRVRPRRRHLPLQQGLAKPPMLLLDHLRLSSHLRRPHRAQARRHPAPRLRLNHEGSRSTGGLYVLSRRDTGGTPVLQTECSGQRRSSRLAVRPSVQAIIHGSGAG